MTQFWKKQLTHKDQDTREIPLNSEKVKLNLSSLCFFAIFWHAEVLQTEKVHKFGFGNIDIRSRSEVPSF